MKTNLNDTALIVLNYNTPQLTIHAVRHVLNLKTGVRVIIVDNDSTDDSDAQLKNEFEKEANVFLVKSLVNGGYAKGNNLGITFAKGLKDITFVGIMNPDVIIDKDALFALVDVLEKNEMIAFATTQTIYNGKETDPSQCAWKKGGLVRWLVGMMLVGTLLRRASSYLLGREWDFTRHYRPKEFSEAINPVFAVQGCLFFGRLSVFMRIMGFDERTFLYYEEDILGEKVKEIGLRNIVLRDYRIYHNHKGKDSLIAKRSEKLFHIKCEYESRCIYLNEYAGYGNVATTVISIVWKFDYLIKKRLVRFLYRD